MSAPTTEQTLRILDDTDPDLAREIREFAHAEILAAPGCAVCGMTITEDELYTTVGQPGQMVKLKAHIGCIVDSLEGGDELPEPSTPPITESEMRGIADALNRYSDDLVRRARLGPVFGPLLAWSVRESHNTAHRLMESIGIRYCIACKHLTGNRYRPVQFTDRAGK